MKKFNQTSILPVIVLLTAFSCAPKQVETVEEVEAINLSYMDTSTRAQDDFFQYVNGSWLAEAEIPADQGRWGSFLELRDQSIAGVKQVMESAKENISEYPKGTDQYKAVTFYTIGMDSLLAEKRGHKVLLPWFEEIEQIKNMADLQAFIGKIHPAGVSAFFNIYVSSDAKDSDQNALYLSQGGLGLPDRDYYVDESNEKFKEIKKKYEAHISKVFQLLGSSEDEAREVAEDVLAIETQLAAASKTRIEMRDAEGRYNKYSIEKLQETTPSLDWSSLFETFGAAADEVIVSSPDFMLALEKVAKLLKMAPGAQVISLYEPCIGAGKF